MENERDGLVLRAKLAEQAERYDDMTKAMKTVTEMDVQLSEEERNLLSVGYKNIMGARRNAWRVISSNEGIESSDKRRELCTKYRESVEGELREICADVQGLLSKYLIPSADSAESKVFYLKTKGDYYRYLAEIAKSDEKKVIIADADQAYKDAFDAGKSLPPTNPIQLGLALNLSVFYYEILNERQKACELAKRAFNDAVADVDDVTDDTFNKDNMLIIQLLRDNLSLWASEDQEEDDETN